MYFEYFAKFNKHKFEYESMVYSLYHETDKS